MASCHKSSYQERKLFELLEEQQEPFLLDVYLHENGYPDNLLRARSLSSTSRCRRLLKLCSRGLKRKGSILKCLLAKLLQAKFLLRAFNLDCISDCVHYICIKDHVRKYCRLSASSLMPFLFDPELTPSPVLELHSENGEGEIWTNSSVSTEEITSSFSSINSSEVSSWIFQQLLKYAYNQTPTAKPTKTYKITEVDFTKQLIQDCAREAKAGIWSSSSSSSEPDFDPERNTENIINEQIDSWQKQRGNITNIANLIDLEFSRSRSEWCNWKSAEREIGYVIEATVFDEMKTELVYDMLETSSRT